MLNKTFTIPVLSRAEKVRSSFLPNERWLFYLLTAVLLLSTLALMNRVHVNTTVLIPSAGGKITEGVIGAPRFVNPVLAISQTDKDITELIYAGLMTYNTDGVLVTELAESYSISDDALVYTFVLHKGLTFHDGTPLTADDVVFTIEKVLQPGIKSPERANWEGVTVDKVNEHTITFTLTKPYAQFLQNTLLGILPQEHWGQLNADEFIFSKLNTSPIGSGPYEFINAIHNTSGIPSRFTLERFTDYVLGAPYIKKFMFNFYSDQDSMTEALHNGEITSMSETSPQEIATLVENKKNTIAITSTLPRIFAVFFNQGNNEALEYKVVRRVLRDTIDKEALIAQVLSGYGRAINSIILEEDPEQEVLSIIDAQANLESGGWKRSDEDGIYYKDELPLALTLTTANSSELKEVAGEIAAIWTALGAQVKVEVFEPGNLAQSVLRTRDYDALLFGEIIGTEPDPYAFWHSSQRNDPGLNIANYTNTTVDNLLVKARKTIETEARAVLYQKAATEINEDIPAIFLYTPNYIYITNKNIRGIQFAQSIEPHYRFANVHLWHIDTTRAWHFLAK